MNINQVRTLNANLSKNYTTHITMLLKVLLNSEGDVIECGGGVFSTPLLHWMCKMMDRKLITYEQDPAYYAFERTFQSRQHRIKFVKDWDEIPINRCGVVFIDHHPPHRRMIETERFSQLADFVIIHDTERKSTDYNIPAVFDKFKFRYDWKDCRPWTSVLSNFKNLSFLGK